MGSSQSVSTPPTGQSSCARFGTTSRRRVLLGGFRDVCGALAAAGCVRLWLDGSFTTDIDIPGDYDLAWDWAGVDPVKLDPILNDYSHAGRVAMSAKYLGDIFINGIEGSSGLLFKDFFQRTRDGKDKGIVVFDPREAT